jgi:putative addiction module component (TIGR02574 family)
LRNNEWDKQILVGDDMSDAAEKLKAQLLELSVEDRAELTSVLVASLEDGEFEDRATVEAAWDVELTQRLEEIKSGKVQGIPATEVLEEMRRKYP